MPKGIAVIFIVVLAVVFVLAIALAIFLPAVAHGDSDHLRFGQPATSEQIGSIMQKLQQAELLDPSVGYCVPDSDGRSELVLDCGVVGHLMVRVWQGEPTIASMSLSEAVATMTPRHADIHADIASFYGGEWRLGDTTPSEQCESAVVWRMTRVGDQLLLQGWSLKKDNQLLGLKVVRAPREVK